MNDPEPCRIKEEDTEEQRDDPEEDNEEQRDDPEEDTEEQRDNPEPCRIKEEDTEEQIGGPEPCKIKQEETKQQRGHWKFNMIPHGKELSEDLKKRIVALHKEGLSYKKISNTLSLSCSTVAKTIQRFNKTGSTQNRPRHGRPKKLSARDKHHIQRLALQNRRMSAASIAAEVKGVGGQPVSAQTIRRTLHQIGLHGCVE